MINLLSKIDQDKIYKILSKNIRSKNDLDRKMKELTTNILKKGESYNTLLNRMFLLQEEIISSSSNECDDFFSVTISNDLLNIIKDYNTGLKSFIKRSIYDYDFKVYCGVELENIISYKDKENIGNEVLRILESVDEKEILETTNDDGDTIKSEVFILKKFLKDFMEIDTISKENLKNFLENLEKLGEEFLTINDEPSQMLSSGKIFIYSALLNYSKTEIEKTVYYKAKLENNFGNNIPANWDQIRRIFIDFLENLGKRTINY